MHHVVFVYRDARIVARPKMLQTHMVAHNRSCGRIKDEGGWLETIGAAHSDLVSLFAYL